LDVRIPRLRRCFVDVGNPLPVVGVAIVGLTTKQHVKVDCNLNNRSREVLTVNFVHHEERQRRKLG
jgi:hypothetical protein